MPKAPETYLRLGLWLLAAVVLAGAAWLHLNRETDEVDAYQDRVNSALLNFDVTWVTRYDGSQQALGGGLGLHEAGVFVARKEDGGDIMFLPSGGVALHSTGLALPPRNRDRLPETTPGGRKLNPLEFRSTDIAVWRAPDGTESLLTSYAYLHAEELCIVGRLAQSPLPPDWQDLLQQGQPLPKADWRVVFETTPCLPPVETAGYPFTGHQAGGQIAISPEGEIYLTVGDFGFDGTEGKVPPYPQQDGNSYGRVLRLTPTDSGPWHADTVALGLRNPQGLDFDARGRMWETEHGPMGGDELNLIRPGMNYGWPAVSLGANYTEEDSDEKHWPFNPVQGRHDGFTPPAFAWVPSIAPSNVRYISDLSPRWDGDLLVAALKDRSVVRLRLDDDRVVFAETIKLQRRVRQVEIGHGRLYILFDFGEFAILTPRAAGGEYVDLSTVMDQQGVSSDGERTIVGGGSILSLRGCTSCHSGSDTPSLTTVFGADIASQPGIDYSAALSAAPGTWTEESLRAFLANPQRFAPGTTMPAPSLSADDIESIIDALRSR